MIRALRFQNSVPVTFRVRVIYLPSSLLFTHCFLASPWCGLLYVASSNEANVVLTLKLDDLTVYLNNWNCLEVRALRHSGVILYIFLAAGPGPGY
jgi:hypothetical protein